MYDYVTARADLDSYHFLTRDFYLTAAEVDTRQREELQELLEIWQSEQPSIWSVLWHFQHIMDLSPRHHFGEAFRFAPWQKEGEIAKKQAELAPFIRPEFQTPFHSLDVAQHLETLRQQMDTQPALTSFDIAEAFLNIVLIPSPANDGEENPPNDRNPHTSLLRTLHRERARWEERKLEDLYRVEGTLSPEPVARTLARLTPYIDALRQSEPDPTCLRLLIKSMQVEPSGSGQIKPYAYNPDRLPPAAPHRLERDRWGGSPCEPGPFDPYAPDEGYDSSWEEDVYGTRIALVTTYAISFEPERPEDLPALHELIRRAVRVLATVPPAFGIPRDYDAEPYERPFVLAETAQEALAPPDREHRENWWHGTPQGAYYDTYCHVLQDQGRVKVYTKLDLDDAFALYYLLEPYMHPNAETAHSLNAARFAEGRSAPQQKDDADSSYDSAYADPDMRLGDLSHLFDEPALVRGLVDTFTLLAGRQITEKAFVEQVTALAAHSLTGIITDVTGTFPPFEPVLAPASPDPSSPAVLYRNHSLTMREAVRDRTHAFLRMMVDLSSDPDLPLAQGLRHAAQEAHDTITQAWQHELGDDMRAHFNKRKEQTGKGWEDLNKAIQEWMENLKARQQENPPSDEDSDLREEADSPSRAFACRTGLVRRDPDVPPCVERVYADTLYTSRLPGSAFPRVELPPALTPFIRPQPHTPSSPPLRLEDCRASLLEVETSKAKDKPKRVHPSPP